MLDIEKLATQLADGAVGASAPWYGMKGDDPSYRGGVDAARAAVNRRLVAANAMIVSQETYIEFATEKLEDAVENLRRAVSPGPRGGTWHQPSCAAQALEDLREAARLAQLAEDNDLLEQVLAAAVSLLG